MGGHGADTFKYVDIMIGDNPSAWTFTLPKIMLARGNDTPVQTVNTIVGLTGSPNGRYIKIQTVNNQSDATFRGTSRQSGLSLVQV